jgi:hypothetical protein
MQSIKLAVPLAIMLLWNALVPLTAHALPLNNTPSEGMFLPVPHQLFPTSYHGMSTFMPDPNSIQGQSIPTFHQSISNSYSNIQNRSNTQDRPTSAAQIQNQSISSPGSNVSHYNNTAASWPTKGQKNPSGGSWNPLFAIAPFLNIPKNLIAPICASEINTTTANVVCPPIIGTQRGDIIIATGVNNARIFGLGGNDVIECGTGNCNVFTAFGNNILMSGSAYTAHLFAGSGGYFRPGNNIFIGAGGETLMVGGNGNDQFYAGSNNLFDGGNDIMIGGSGANYFDCGPNGNGVILDFNPAKGDTKAPNCKYVITTYNNNIFGPGIPDNITGGLLLGSGSNPNIAGLTGSLSSQNSSANQVNNTAAASGLLSPSGQNLNANQPNIARLMGLLSPGQNLNANQPAAHTSSGKALLSRSSQNLIANQPNIARLMGLLSPGQNLNANQPTNGRLMGLLSPGQNLNANQPNNTVPMAFPTSNLKSGFTAKSYP